MRFYTVRLNNHEVPAVSVDGGKHLYPALRAADEPYPDVNAIICAAAEDPGILQAIGEQIAARDPAASIDLTHTQVELLSPIVRPLQDVICLGINYDEHAREAGNFSSDAFGGERPYTIYFSKRINRALGDGEPIPPHKDVTDQLDYECELAVIIGKTCDHVSAAEADKYIFGYTILNDVTARNLQTRHKQWYLGKSLDGFTPLGPCIVTPDELGDAEDLGISCYVNDEVRQSSNTRHMIQTIGGAIEEISAGITLLPGTIIAMGTPSGVGMGFDPPRFLHTGDVVRCHIDGIGDLSNPIG